eukprot:UN04918
MFPIARARSIKLLFFYLQARVELFVRKTTGKLKKTQNLFLLLTVTFFW